MSSPDDKLSENIWFVWSKTSYGGDKWKCHAWTQTDTHIQTCEYRARILWNRIRNDHFSASQNKNKMLKRLITMNLKGWKRDLKSASNGLQRKLSRGGNRTQGGPRCVWVNIISGQFLVAIFQCSHFQRFCVTKVAIQHFFGFCASALADLVIGCLFSFYLESEATNNCYLMMCWCTALSNTI